MMLLSVVILSFCCSKNKFNAIVKIVLMAISLQAALRTMMQQKCYYRYIYSQPLTYQMWIERLRTVCVGINTAWIIVSVTAATVLSPAILLALGHSYTFLSGMQGPGEQIE